MSMMMILSVLVFLVSVVGLIYTYVVMKNQKYLQSEMDTKLNERVQSHPYIRNPIFIAYVFGFLAFLAIVAYVAALYY
ncbi:flagellar basal body-associated protein FliL [Bacillus fengqiuensis]|nr:flagellar basal body-associated protein FliL [Bacillus fengqiuensis]